MLSFPVELHNVACIEITHLFIVKQILLSKKKNHTARCILQYESYLSSWGCMSVTRIIVTL